MSVEGRPNLADSVDEIPENALRILAAAVTLFSRKGYAATSVREIVQEAQVTNPMLYYYFDSKEGLFVFLTELMHREFMRDVADAIERSGTFEDALEGIGEVHMKGVRESPDALRFVYSLLFGAVGSCPSNRLFESHQHVEEALVELFEHARAEGSFEPAFEPRWLVCQLLGLINSHSMRLIKELELVPEDQRAAWLSETTDSETVRRLVRLFLYGAGKVEMS